MSDRKIEFVPLEDLTPDPRNPKAHDTATITESVDRFGYVEPVVLDGRTGYIVSGHGRVKTLTAMREDGATPPNGVTVKGKTWLVPVVTGWESGNDMEAAAALIALNRTTELGGWVDDALLELLDELTGMDDGLDGVGFDENDLRILQIRLDGQLGSLSDLADQAELDEPHIRPEFPSITVHFPDQEIRDGFVKNLQRTTSHGNAYWYPYKPESAKITNING